MRTPVDEAAESTLPHGLERSQLHDLYYATVLTRAVEERLEVLFRQGRVTGGLYRSLGQEAGAVGTAYALRRRTDGTGDVIAHSIRETGALLLMGGTPYEYFTQYMARGTSPTGGKEANVHWTDVERGFVGPVSPLGTMVGIMAGITLTFRQTGQDRVGMVYAGDGATSTGAFHEGLNLAAVQGCPMVMVVEHNQWAFSTPTHKQTRVESFVEKAPGYGVAAESVDGCDVLAVYEAASRAVARARRGEGVSLLELRYYRRKGHAQHDAQEYVPEAELDYWAQRDPVTLFRDRLVGDGLVQAAELELLDQQAEDDASQAAERAMSDPEPGPSSALQSVYGHEPAPEPWTRRTPAVPGDHDVSAGGTP